MRSLKPLGGTRVGELLWTLADAGRGLERLAARGPPWAGLLHPFGLVLALLSVALASLIGRMPSLDPRSGQAPWVLATGLGAYLACVGVVSLWPASPPGLRRLRNARNRIARQLSARIGSASPDAPAELERLRAAALARIDDEIVPAFAQLLQRDAGVNSEIELYKRSSFEPDPHVLARLEEIHAQHEKGTRACAQRAVDAEAGLFALLQERDDGALVTGLRTWVDDLGELVAAVSAALTLPHWAVPPPQAAASEPVLEDALPVSMTPPPSDFADLTRRALRALNRPGTLARSGLVSLLRSSLGEIWERSGQPRPANPSPLEQGQALRTMLVAAIERLNVSDGDGMQVHQHQVLRMQYLMGLTVVQVAIRLSIAEKTVFRRSAEGVDAVAHDLWRREQLLAGPGRSKATA
jgi:hypothetical protein